MKRVFAVLLSLLMIAAFGLSQEASAGKLKPGGEKFTPGQWFLGDKPANYNSSKPPIVFVQGKNGSSTSWYGETVYHGVNDMYTKAYEAGYQTVFVQLYDAAGNGSESQYTNGRLLATMLAQISNHFNGQKVNIVAHSKGGPDTQAALVHYGAYKYVGRVITLGSPHYGSELADLSYSWYAGWLGDLLGQQDAGTYSLQTGEMAKFRSATDSHTYRSKNKYYTVAGTNKGPTLSALALGGAYLSSYGANDGLVTATSAKLPYGTHLFTDSTIDHDNIRMGSKVFSRIEPYLRSVTVSEVIATGDVTEASSKEDNVIHTESSNYITGGELSVSEVTSQEIYIPTKTSGTISVYTASDATSVELVSPNGTVLKATAPIKDHEMLPGASLYSFQVDELSEGSWTVQMKAADANDAYLLVSSFDEEAKVELEMAGMGKADETTFTLKTPQQQDGITSYSFKFKGPNGDELKQTITSKLANKGQYTGKLPKFSTPGLYNMTVDVVTKYPNGKASVRTIVRSVYID